MTLTGCGLLKKAADQLPNIDLPNIDIPGLDLSGGDKDKPSTRDGEDGGSSSNGVITGKAKSYSEAYDQLTSIRDAMESTISQMTETYDETDMVFYSLMLISLDLAFTASLNEDEQTIKAIEMVYGMFGWADVKAQRVAPHHYKITFTNDEGVAVAYDAKFDTGSGSLQLVQSKDGNAESFYEFINLGGGDFAFQTDRERAIVTYKDGQVKSFSYSQKHYDGEKYDSSKDSIFPGGKGANASWVFTQSVDDYPQAYAFDGKTLKFDADPFFGNRISIEISK